jgi:predicted DNA-binding helix-hairpin-helix protein
MDAEAKIDLLGGAARYDICRGCGTESSRTRDDLGRWIYPAIRPDGKRIAMLKVLQSNVCEKDCAYCANRSGRDEPRSSFRPEELARLFDEMARRNLVQGLFLSSGVYRNVDYATERMLATVELVRRRYQFGGYIHLKILPGADEASIEASLNLADRVSVNLEAPNAERIRALSSTKDFRRELVAPLMTADRLRHGLHRRVSLTTQFVVGAAHESDAELLRTSSWLYRHLNLARAYYSAFQPIRDTPLENLDATPTWREHRLYQADFLLRQYGFGFDELVFGSGGNLMREADPKLTWARQHPEFFPIELNTAPRTELLRVPGIGPISAAEILNRRRQGALHELSQAGLSPQALRQAAPYVLLAGRRPSFQYPLW